jgi:hypothetical protein
LTVVTSASKNEKIETAKFQVDQSDREGHMKVGISAFAWTALFGPQHLDLLPRIKEMGLGNGQDVDPVLLLTSNRIRCFCWHPTWQSACKHPDTGRAVLEARTSIAFGGAPVKSASVQ